MLDAELLEVIVCHTKCRMEKRSSKDVWRGGIQCWFQSTTACRQSRIGVGQNWWSRYAMLSQVPRHMGHLLLKDVVLGMAEAAGWGKLQGMSCGPLKVPWLLKSCSAREARRWDGHSGSRNAVKEDQLRSPRALFLRLK